MTGEVTRLLGPAAAGDPVAIDRLFTLVYEDLRRRARLQLRDSGPSTLSPTALVHEAYLKLVGGEAPGWADQGHFFRVAARAMRHVIVDHARAKRAAKRGDGLVLAGLEPDSRLPGSEGDAGALLALDEALTDLDSRSARLASVVELRFFVGLSVEDTAQVLGITDRTVKRDWRLARAFLYDRMDPAPGAPE